MKNFVKKLIKKKDAYKHRPQQSGDSVQKLNDAAAQAREERIKRFQQNQASVQAAMNTFTPAERKAFEERLYQYQQDIHCGGADPEWAMHSRDMVRVNGDTVVPREVAERMKTLETPYSRAKKPFEVADPHSTSLYGEEARYFLPLSQVQLAPSKGWGQCEYLKVDTRTWQPYYIMEQYDGALAAQTWYEIKEKVTWEEVEKYADPDRKFELGGSKRSSWEELAVQCSETRENFCIRWRQETAGMEQAECRREGENFILTHTPSSKSAVLTPQDCCDPEAFREAVRWKLSRAVWKDYIIGRLWEYVKK